MSTLKVNSIIPVAGVPTGGGGGIIQVVQETKTDTASHSVNINQGAANFSLIMSKAITPIFSTSKILVQFSVSGNVEGNGVHCDFVLRKTVGSTVTHPILGDSASNYTSITTGFRSGGGNQHNVGQCIYQFLDDAGTTSAKPLPLGSFPLEECVPTAITELPFNRRNIPASVQAQ